VSVNDAPNSTDSQITISEDTLHIFSPSDFPFADVDGDQFAGIVIGSLPDAGSLLLANNPVVAGEFISLSEIDDGDFVLIPMPGEPDNIISGFDYQVRDNGGTLNTGTDTSVSKNRIDFNVAGVNDAPQIVTNTASVDEGDELVITEEFLTGFDPDDTGPQELTFTVQNFPRNGELNLSGSELTTGDSFTLADIIAGRLSYEHDGSETETDQIEFSLADGGEDGASPSAGELSLLIREVIDSAPDAVNEQLVLPFGESFDSTAGDVLASGNSVLSGAVLMENPEFILEIVEEPQQGTLNLLPNGAFIYEHNGSANRVDQFSYRIINEDGLFTVATVDIMVEPPLEFAFQVQPLQSLLLALEVIKHNSIRTIDFGDFDFSPELQRIDVEFVIDEHRVGISNTNFLRALQQVDSDLQKAESENTLKIQLSNDAVFGISISATAGIVAWALRGGALLASVMAATPIWASIDPLRVVNSKEENDENQDSSDVEKIFE